MSQTKILIDTNTYLRLAQSIRPLLGNSFGKDNFTLYIHKEIENELNRSSRLQNKFYWIEAEEYKINRKKKLNIPKEIQTEIENTYEHIWEFQRDEKLGLSKEDIYCIATALEMQVSLVTDDQNMIKVCKEFEVEAFSTVKLLKMMFVNSHINFKKVIEITEYWKYEKDIPSNFNKDYKKFFSSYIKKK